MFFIYTKFHIVFASFLKTYFREKMLNTKKIFREISRGFSFNGNPRKEPNMDIFFYEKYGIMNRKFRKFKKFPSVLSDTLELKIFE